MDIMITVECIGEICSEHAIGDQLATIVWHKCNTRKYKKNVFRFYVNAQKLTLNQLHLPLEL